eukprot:TRINITY_DN3016_c0_g1_i2.p1 TRINITY_DN3016_c0_g1~~TRINITY_DN3016_c0_g1_i2.p1  ORF type:complete len:376 (-),score=74.97 TRINITY_DN3016_c0_g1_i2:60-1187(-)
MNIEKIQELSFKGIPHSLRPTVWKLLLQTKKLEEGSNGKNYTWYLQQDPSAKVLEDINLDIGRTFSYHRLFKTKEGQNALRNVLIAYSNYNDLTPKEQKVGYCQGMNFVCATLLMTMTEEEAFWSFVAMMNRLEHYYQPEMAGLMRDDKIFNGLLHKNFPTLAKHFDQLKINTIIWTGKWFLVLFTDLKDWETVMRIWDIIMAKGNYSLIQISLAIFKCNSEQSLVKKSLEELMQFLLNPPIPSSADELLKEASAIDIENLVLEFSYDEAKSESKADTIEQPKKSLLSGLSSLIFGKPKKKEKSTTLPTFSLFSKPSAPITTTPAKRSLSSFKAQSEIFSSKLVSTTPITERRNGGMKRAADGELVSQVTKKPRL